MSKKIDKLIINSPFTEPSHYWKYNPESRDFTQMEGRRPAGYVIASEVSKSFDDPGIFMPIPLVNKIRPRVKEWRENNYHGVSGITRQLLEHWNDKTIREYQRFFFCQLEAIETLIWLTEAPESERSGIVIPSDGGEFVRQCCKMATGTGKTVVMAMAIAWQILNKVTYPQDPRFSKNIFVVAPGLTVKSRLQVLLPGREGNYYDEFNVVPAGLKEKLRLGKVLVRNWHILNWDSEARLKRRRSVDKRGAVSDEAYVREVLGDMAGAKNILVINDEAHHAWRVNLKAEGKDLRSRELKESVQEATIWIGGLDRIHKARRIMKCLDFSATPFAPSGKKASEEALYGWIVSDFGLNDSIESGLVKTPRVVIRDDAVPDASTYKSKLYHIYEYVKTDLNHKAEEHAPLPDLVLNAYLLLGTDWKATAKSWKKEGHQVPPVMISVVNRTETAARVKYAFDHKNILIEELCDPARMLHIDSKVLEQAEEREEFLEEGAEPEAENGEEEKLEKKLSKKDLAEDLRKKVDTVGKLGEKGEQIQNVISVGMLSEGWDAKTVTHIMGLRAFTSQLLCEQVVGRGLRRTSYEISEMSGGLFDAEYVNIFGVPFTFLPHESPVDVIPLPPKPKTQIMPSPEKIEYEIKWPNVVRIEYVYKTLLKLDLEKVQSLTLNASDAAQLAQLAPIIEGKPDVSKIMEIDLQKLANEFRLQKIIFKASVEIFDQMKPTWTGNKDYLLAQLFGLVERFLDSDKIMILPGLFSREDLRRRIVLALNMSRIVRHIWEAIRQENSEVITPIFDTAKPIRSTRDMNTWYTGRPVAPANRSHINFCVYDSAWESCESFHIERSQKVSAWVKNDHLGFEIPYIYKGERKNYRPDFILRMADGTFLVIETKGQETDQDKTKRAFLEEWIKAVNEHGGFGKWRFALSRHPSDIQDIL